MKIKLLVPAIVFIILSLLIIIGNTIFMQQGRWGMWSINNIAAIICHGLTMIVGLYLLSGALKK